MTSDTSDTGVPDGQDVSGVELVRVGDDLIDAYVAAFDLTFGRVTTDASTARAQQVMEPGRAVAARRVDGEVVATAEAYSFTMSLPHGTGAPCAGISHVSVRADHRRRGVLTRMMRWCLDDARDRGEPLAALWASESPIYGRYGFGPAAPTATLEIDRLHGALDLDGPLAQVRLVDRDTALADFPAIYERMGQLRAGLLSRSSTWWERVVDDDPPAPGGEVGSWRYALLPGRGYAIHRLRSAWPDDVPDGTVEVHDLVATDPEANAALWRFVIDTDLAAHLRAVRRPVDDPVIALLRDRQRARITDGWALQVRIVDLAAAFEARGFRVDGACVLDLDDRFCPDNHGRWRLEVAQGRARCERVGTEVAADVTLDAAALASIYLGGTRAAQLAAAGRIGGAPDAIAALDRLLAVDLAPWHGGMF